MTTVWTNGCFDLFHAGHVMFLERAAKLGTLTVFMNSDASVRYLKGERRPIVEQAYRRKVLEALRCVAHVHVFNEPTPIKYWTSLGTTPDIYVKDSECDVTHTDEGQWLLSRGVAVTVLPRIPDISTTILERRIREQGSVPRS